MTEKKEKVYIGNMRTIEGEGYSFLSGSICLEDIKDEFITLANNGKRYVNFDVFKNRDGVSRWGNSHYVTQNTFVPKKKDSPASQVADSFGGEVESPPF